jgi:hypothetical protein
MPSPVCRPSGCPRDQILVLGEGTWHLAEDPARRRPEIAALRCGPGIGMNLMTPPRCMRTEMRKCWSARQSQAGATMFSRVSRVLPHHATRSSLRACRTASGAALAATKAAEATPRS